MNLIKRATAAKETIHSAAKKTIFLDSRALKTTKTRQILPPSKWARQRYLESAIVTLITLTTCQPKKSSATSNLMSIFGLTFYIPRRKMVKSSLSGTTKTIN